MTCKDIIVGGDVGGGPYLSVVMLMAVASSILDDMLRVWLLARVTHRQNERILSSNMHVV